MPIKSTIMELLLKLFYSSTDGQQLIVFNEIFCYSFCLGFRISKSKFSVFSIYVNL